jgi:hypothetical protein
MAPAKDLQHGDIEDDYGDESDADSVVKDSYDPRHFYDGKSVG